MKVVEWKDKLMVQLPEKLIKSLELKPGDELEIVTADCALLEVARTDSSQRKQAIERIIKRSWQIPDDYVFDRQEANSR